MTVWKQPQRSYVEDAKLELPRNASWSRIARLAWKLQLAAEREEDARCRELGKFEI